MSSPEELSCFFCSVHVANTDKTSFSLDVRAFVKFISHERPKQQPSRLEDLLTDPEFKNFRFCQSCQSNLHRIISLLEELEVIQNTLVELQQKVARQLKKAVQQKLLLGTQTRTNWYRGQILKELESPLTLTTTAFSNTDLRNERVRNLQPFVRLIRLEDELGQNLERGSTLAVHVHQIKNIKTEPSEVSELPFVEIKQEPSDQSDEQDEQQPAMEVDMKAFLSDFEDEGDDSADPDFPDPLTLCNTPTTPGTGPSKKKGSIKDLSNPTKPPHLKRRRQKCVTTEAAANTPRPFQCTQCPRNYRHDRGLRFHIRAVHNKETCFSCPHCPYKSIQKSKIKRHVAARHNPNRTKKDILVCETCGQSFIRKGQYELHCRRHEQELKVPPFLFICPHCPYQSIQKSKVKRHVERRHNLDGSKKDPFVCDICGKSFKREGKLKLHSKSHQAEQQPPTTFICSHCPYKSVQKSKVKRHEAARHDPEKNAERGKKFVCEICGKSFRFSQEYLYNWHKRSHTGEKPFICRGHGCGKSYGTCIGRTLHEKKAHCIDKARDKAPDRDKELEIDAEDN